MRNLTRDEARQRSELLDVDSYDVDLDLGNDPRGAERFGSTTVVRFTSGAGRTFLELDGEVRAATLDGRPLDLPQGNRLPLHLSAGAHEVRVVADCATSRSGEGLHRFADPADGAVYLWAQSFLDDAQRTFACFDQPDLKAAVRLSVTAPAGWTVVANARGAREGRRWVFAETPPLSTYLVTLAAGPWHGVQRHWQGLELGLWCRRSLAEHLDADADELFTVTEQCFAHQQRVFGRDYPFGDTYDQLFVPEFNHGAMENPGAVTFSEDFVFRSRATRAQRRTRAMVVAHEMAHMWFGDLVTMRWWDDLWLNESFAEMLGYSTVEEATGFEGAWTDFCAARKAWGYRADAAPTTHPVSGPVADNRSALLNFDGISYAKGASVLRQLAVLLGPEVFFAGVRRYLDAHAWGNTAFADLLAALEQESGRPLGEWAHAWLRTSGTSLLRAVVEGAAVAVVQESPVLREHRTALGRYELRDGALVRVERLDVRVQGARTPTPAAPADLLLVNDGDLTFARTRFDDRSLATVVAALGGLVDPLARALCVASLWDALRDAELPARLFLQAVRGVLPVERDPGVLEALLTQARRAAGGYRVRSAQDDALAELAADAESLAQRAEPGSDLQLVLVRGWASCTVDAERLSAVRSGSGAPGLTVDADLRWHLVKRLAALGAVDDAEIDAELERDPTAAGERAAAYARAARPDARAKRRAWDAVTGDAELSNHEAAALAEGLWQRGQDALLSDCAERYVREIEAVWSRRSPQLAQSAARLLYPATLISPEVVALTDGLLARPALPPGLRRIVLEQRDELARALAGQAADASGHAAGHDAGHAAGHAAGRPAGHAAGPAPARADDRGGPGAPH